MPSGAKKRKAAKKKLGKKDHNNNHNNNNNNNNGSHSNPQGIENPKTHDERDRDIDGVVVQTEGNVEGSGVEEGSKEANVHSDDVAREFKNGSNKSSSSSGSGSSSNSDDEEVVVEKEKSEVPELEASVETSGVSEVVNEAVDDSIPMEESVKQVVSFPQVSTVVSESVPVDNSSTSDVIESGLKQNVYEGFEQHDEKSGIASGIEKVAEKVIEVVDGGSETTSEPITARDGAGLLPQSSSDKAVKGCCADDDCKVSETQKYAEEQQPLLSSAPLPARRTSWMNCCGLLEVFSGGSSR